MHMTIDWNGIAIEITYDPDYVRYDELDVHYAYLEIRSNPPRHPLPITETGYLSHFIPPHVIDEAGGADAYVLQWLESADQSKIWKRNLDQYRQPSLL